MCVAYPGKVLSIEKNHARVDFSGSVVPVNISMVSVRPGDYVLVHAGMAIQKVETEEAKEWIALFRDLEAAAAEGDADFPLKTKNDAAEGETNFPLQAEHAAVEGDADFPLKIKNDAAATASWKMKEHSASSATEETRHG